MKDEAIKSLRALFLVTLLALALWLISWPSAIEKLTQYKNVRDLHAWLYLKERIAEFEMDVFDRAPDETITAEEVERVSPTPQGGDYTETIPPRVDATWPTVAQYPFTLEPVEFYRTQGNEDITEFARIYRVQSAASDLPLSDYFALFLPDQDTAVVAANDRDFIDDSKRGLRLLIIAANRRNRPKSWNEVSLHLVKHGFTENPAQLQRKNSALARLQAESDPRLLSGGVQVFGMQLSIGFFFSSVGILLGAVAFAMIGPIKILRASANQSSLQPWILSVPTTNHITNQILEVIISAITIAWALFPIAVLLMQLLVDVELAGVGEWTVPIGVVGLIFSSVVYGFAAWVLRKSRRHATQS